MEMKFTDFFHLMHILLFLFSLVSAKTDAG